MQNRWLKFYVLWVAQGLGLGRSPIAPGTFGSLLGLLWFAMLLRTGQWWSYFLGIAIGFAASVWFCGRGEELLHQKDPGSIVLDEITALPVCFVSFIAMSQYRYGHWPALEFFFSGTGWGRTLVVFALFRAFDILKPWPIRQSQKLTGGWGVTVDDFIAGFYVALVTWPFA